MHIRTIPTRVVSAIAVTVLGASALALVGQPALAAEPVVGLGRAAPFVVLAGTTVTNTGPTVVSGDLGVSPGSALTGWPPGVVVNGAPHSADAEAGGARTDLMAAWVTAAGRAADSTVSADLAGQTLVGGVYAGGALALNGSLTLDAEGVPDTVWIFQAASTLITGSNSSVALVNGANPCNVFWQVGSSATLGTGTAFVGTVLALTSITATTGASVAGRLLAHDGAVTLDDNRITSPDCTPSVTTTVAGATTTVAGATTTVAGATTTVAGATTTVTVNALEVTTTLPGSTGARTTTPPSDAITTATTLPRPSVQETPPTPAIPTTPPTPATPTTPPAPGSPDTTVPELPRTGSGVNAVGALALVLLVAGALLLRLSQRVRRCLDDGPTRAF